jgi:hypothetical protein
MAADGQLVVDPGGRYRVAGESTTPQTESVLSFHQPWLTPLTVSYLCRHLAMLDAERRRSETATTMPSGSSATRTGARCIPTRSLTGSTD